MPQESVQLSPSLKRQSIIFARLKKPNYNLSSKSRSILLPSLERLRVHYSWPQEFGSTKRKTKVRSFHFTTLQTGLFLLIYTMFPLLVTRHMLRHCPVFPPKGREGKNVSRGPSSFNVVGKGFDGGGGAAKAVAANAVVVGRRRTMQSVAVGEV